MPKFFEPDLLDEMYGPIEEMGKSYDVSKDAYVTFPGFSRGDLITINGKTIREKMMDEYLEQSGEIKLFPDYYRENVVKKTAEYVEEALKKSQYIEMFEYGKDGTLSEEPIQLVEKENPKVRIPEDSLQKVMESRKQIKLYHLSGHSELLGTDQSRWIEDYYGNLSFARVQRLRDNVFANPHGFGIARNSRLSLVMLHMAAKGYSLEEIMDSDKLKEEKRKAGEEILNHLTAKVDKKVMAEEIAERTAEKAVEMLKKAGVKPTEDEIKAAQDEIKKAEETAGKSLTEDETATIALKKVVKLGEDDIGTILSESDITLTEEEKREAQEKYGEPLTENEIGNLTWSKTARLMADKAATLIRKRLPHTEEEIDVKLSGNEINGASTSSVIKSKVHEEDNRWFAEQMLKGQYKLMDEIDRFFESLDWSSDSDFMNHKNAGVYALTDTLFDGAQEIEHILKGDKGTVETVADNLRKEHPELGTAEQLIDDFRVRPKLPVVLISAIRISAETMNNLMVGNGVGAMVAGKVNRMRQAIRFVKEANPGIPLSRLDADKIVKSLDAAEENFGMDLADYDALVQDPETQRLIGHEMLSGNLQKNIKVTYNHETGEISYEGTMTPEIKFAKKLEENSRYKPQKEYSWIQETWKPLVKDNPGKCYDTYREHYASMVKGMLDDIEAVDPSLVRSSHQFSEMKKSLKQLKKLLQEDTKKNQTVELRNACAQLQQRTQEYLDYKHVDEIGKKRSKLEFKRVLTAQRLLRMSRAMNHLSAQVPTPYELQRWGEQKIKKENREALTQKIDQAFHAPIYQALGGAKMKGTDRDVMEALKASLENRKEKVIQYVNHSLPVEPAELGEKNKGIVKRALADMVIMEVIARERIKEGFRPGMTSIVKPGQEEREYAEDYVKYLKKITNMEVFNEEMQNMSPEKAKAFVLNGKAREIAKKIIPSVNMENNKDESRKSNMVIENSTQNTNTNEVKKPAAKTSMIN